MCILISCSSVLCVLMTLSMFMCVKVMSSLISAIDESSTLFVLSVCAYGGIFLVFGFLYKCCFLYCDDVRLGVVY